MGRCGHIQAADDVHAGGFTGARLAHDGHELALFNFHADVVGGFYRGVTHPVIFAHILKFDQRSLRATSRCAATVRAAASTAALTGPADHLHLLHLSVSADRGGAAGGVDHGVAFLQAACYGDVIIIAGAGGHLDIDIALRGGHAGVGVGPRIPPALPTPTPA